MLIEERGFDAVTIGEIAEAADVSVPTFYAHYASKEALLMSVPTREAVAAVLDPGLAHLSPGARLRAAIRLFLTFQSEHHRDLVLERWRIIARTPSLRLRTAEFERTTAAILVDVMLPEGAPVAPSTTVAVNAMMSAYTQVLLRWAEEGGRRDLLEVADEVFDELRDNL